jgi:hypothetical protein
MNSASLVKYTTVTRNSNVSRCTENCFSKSQKLKCVELISCFTFQKSRISSDLPCNQPSLASHDWLHANKINLLENFPTTTWKRGWRTTCSLLITKQSTRTFYTHNVKTPTRGCKNKSVMPSITIVINTEHTLKREKHFCGKSLSHRSQSWQKSAIVNVSLSPTLRSLCGHLCSITSTTPSWPNILKKRLQL